MGLSLVVIGRKSIFIKPFDQGWIRAHLPVPCDMGWEGEFRFKKFTMHSFNLFGVPWVVEITSKNFKIGPSLTIVTSIKSLEDIFTHRSHIRQVTRTHPHSPVTPVKSLEGILTSRVTSVKSQEYIFTHQSHISQVF